MKTQIADIIAPRAPSKQAKLVGLLSRKSGVTIIKASQTLEWQVHTTRAALTGLRKRGYMIERKTHSNKDSSYIINSDETKI